MSESIEALTGKSREAILEDLLDSGRSVTPVEYIARTEIIRLTARIAELEKALKPFADRASTDTVQDADKFNILLVITNGKRMCAIDPKAFVEARTTLEASERGGGE